MVHGYRVWDMAECFGGRVRLVPTVTFTATLGFCTDMLRASSRVHSQMEEGQSVTIQALRATAWEATPSLPQLFSLLPNLHPHLTAIACSGS